MPPATIKMSPDLNPVCEGTDVKLTGGPTGSAGLYTYLWSGPNGFTSSEQNPPVISQITPFNAGNYTLKVTSVYGCTSTTSFSLQVNGVTFNGTYGPYCIQDVPVALSVNQLGVVFSGRGITGNSSSGFKFDPKAAGVGKHPIAYSYTNNGCSVNKTMMIEVVDLPQIVTNTVVLKTCTGSTADLTAAAVTEGSTSGLKPFTYWNDVDATSPVADPKAVSAGIYYIYAETPSGKCFDIQSVTVSQPDSLRAKIVASPMLQCTGDTTGTLTASITMGTAPFTYQWSTQPAQTGPSASNLRAGIYSVVITDYKGCSAAFTGEVTEPAPLKIGYNVNHIHCLSDANGSARVDSINGSTDPKILNSYKYSWATKPVQTTREAVRLTAWWHPVTLTSEKGCAQTDSVFIDVKDVTHPTITCPKDIEMTVQAIKSLDGSPNKYTVDIGKPIVWDDCAVDTITNDAPEKYRTGLTKIVWTVTDQMGLTDTCTQNVYIKEFPNIPQLLSPNGDGMNDKFMIDGLTAIDYPNSQISIFTRSGQLVFRNNNYEDPENAWNGRYAESNFSKNKLVAPGVYYYILKLGGTTSQTLKGYVYVYY
jgi:gliding motility-associated-like protein